MKKIALALLVLASLLSPARAQLTQAQVITDINTQLLSCSPNRCNTAASLRGLLAILAQASFQAQGINGLSLSGAAAAGSVIMGTGPTSAAWSPLFTAPQTITGLWAFQTSPTVPTLSPGANNTQAASTAYVDAAAALAASLAAVASPAALAAAIIPASQTRLLVVAMAATGTTTCGLTFTKGTSTPTGIYGEVLNAASAIYWEPQYSTDPVRACEFGTVSDGSQAQNFTSGVTTFGGTDNTVAIQAAINFGLQGLHNTVCFNSGKYRFTDTLHLGWGDSFYSMNLDYCAFNVSSSTGGVNLYADGIGDRCAISIQGGRGSGVHHINLNGLNSTWAFASVFSNPWPTVPDGWLLPGITPTGTNPGGLNRYAPYGGICEDIYSGQPPTSLNTTFTASIGASFTGTGSGNQLTVSAVTGFISQGDLVTGTGVPANTFIAAFVSGVNGGAGVYATNNPTTSSGNALTTTSDVLNVTAASANAVKIGMVVGGGGVITSPATRITAFISGTGTTGTYQLSGAFQSQASASLTGSFPEYPQRTNYPAFTTLQSNNVSVAPAGGAGTNAVVTWGITQHWLSTNCNSLPLSGNCPIVFTAGSLPAGLSLNTYYYVKSYVSGTTFNISATPGGAAITISASGSGLTAARQFGMNFSSQPTIDNGAINGFAVNVNLGSSTANSQGDFAHIYNENSSFSVYSYSVGNDQSRNVKIQDSQFAFCYAALTNIQFGERVGKLGGPIDNLSGGECYEAFEIGSQSFGFPVLINTFYAEGLTRFMNLGVASTPNGVLVNGCDISFGSGLGTSTNVTLPVALIEMGGAPVTLNDCSLGDSIGRIYTLSHGSAGSLTLSGGIWQFGGTSIPSLNLPGLQVAHSFTGGLLVSGTASTIAQNSTNVSNRIVWGDPIFATRMNSQTTFSGAQQMKASADFTTWGVRAVYTQATQGWYELNNRVWRQFATAPMTGSPNLSSAAFTTVPAAMSSCDVLTFNYKQAGINVANSTINVGDILYWTGDGTIFAVTSVGALTGGAYPYTAKQMNNMVVNGTTGACVSSLLNDPTLTGQTTIIHAAGTLYLDLLHGAVPAAPGSGYTPGTQTLTSTGGTCTTQGQWTVTVNAAGQVTLVTANTVPPVCSVLPTNPVTTTGGGGTLATLNLITAPDNIRVPQALFYTTVVGGVGNLNNISLNGTSATPNGANIDTWMKPGDILWGQSFPDPAFPWFPPLLGLANNLSTLGPVSSGTSTTAGSAFVNGVPVMGGRHPLSPLPIVGVGTASAQISAAVPTGSGTCPIDNQVGNNQRGTFQLNGACSIGTVILTFALQQPTGWYCSATDRTNPTNVFNQTASTTTAATLSGTGADNDVIAFECGPY